MSNIQQYSLTWSEWKAKGGTAYYVDSGSFYVFYKVDSTIANQIVFSNKLFYTPPLTSTQQTNLTDFQTNVLGTATQVYTLDEVIGLNF